MKKLLIQILIYCLDFLYKYKIDKTKTITKSNGAPDYKSEIKITNQNKNAINITNINLNIRIMDFFGLLFILIFISIIYFYKK